MTVINDITTYVKGIQKRVITWTSLSFNELAISDLSVKLKYFFAWNSRSNSKSWPLVNAVLLRRDLFSINWRTSAAVFCLFGRMPLTHFPGNQFPITLWAVNTKKVIKYILKKKFIFVRLHILFKKSCL